MVSCLTQARSLFIQPIRTMLKNFDAVGDVSKFLCKLLLVLLGCAQSAFAQSSTFAWIYDKPGPQLIELSADSLLSRYAAALRWGGYELAGGQFQSFDAWYGVRGLPDIHMSWLVPVSANWGWIWGFRTGERGAKYSIAPGLKLGWVYDTAVSSQSRLSVKATTVLGGRMVERPCSSDFGEIGGLRLVNCRLAASTLTPEQSLGYLINLPPPDRYQVSVQYQYSF